VFARSSSRLALTADATTQMSDNRLLVGDSSAQLYQANLGTKPDRWNRKRDEREGMPVVVLRSLTLGNGIVLA
jgi:hypothetical protein